MVAALEPSWADGTAPRTSVSSALETRTRITQLSVSSSAEKERSGLVLSHKPRLVCLEQQFMKGESMKECVVKLLTSSLGHFVLEYHCTRLSAVDGKLGRGLKPPLDGFDRPSRCTVNIEFMI